MGGRLLGEDRHLARLRSPTPRLMAKSVVVSIPVSSSLKHGLDQSPVYGKLSYLTIEEIENRIDQLIRNGELRSEFFGDLPLILLTDQSWLSIQPWAHEYECHLAASADARRLTEILNDWRNRRREEQHQLLESMASTERGAARRVLQAWHGLAGKEMRSRIETALSTLP